MTTSDTYRVAAATSDGVNVDLHFGAADAFTVYEISGGAWRELERRELPPGETEPAAEAAGPSGCGCGGGGAQGPALELLSDCRCVLCARIGPGMERALQKRSIAPFAVALPLEEAMEKIISYYGRREHRHGDISG